MVVVVVLACWGCFICLVCRCVADLVGWIGIRTLWGQGCCRLLLAASALLLANTRCSVHGPKQRARPNGPELDNLLFRPTHPRLRPHPQSVVFDRSIESSTGARRRGVFKKNAHAPRKIKRAPAHTCSLRAERPGHVVFLQLQQANMSKPAVESR